MNEIWHIYYATRGTAGNYIDALLKASSIAGIKARAFVSSEYRFSFGKIVKCFFPFTDLTNKRNIMIKLLRGIELMLAYIYISITALIYRPRIVIHLIDDLSLTYLFFKFSKLAGLKVSITCHDVSSHYTGISRHRRDMLNRANYLIVHNDGARKSLGANLGNHIENKVRTYPFPFSAYDEILNPEKLKLAGESIQNDLQSKHGYYLFIGVVRNSKGIDTLIESWPEANKDKKQRLVIAGSWTDPEPSLKNKINQDISCSLIDRYLEDEEFFQLIKNARFVVLPYKEYAHSAIFFSCASQSCPVIISDINLFNDFLPEYDLKFQPGDKHGLIAALKKSMSMSDEQVRQKGQLVRQVVEAKNSTLAKELKSAFSVKED